MVVLQGDPSLIHSKISLKAMIKTVRKEGAGMLVEVKQLEGTESSNSNTPAVPKFLQKVVGQYAKVFSVPEGLPPYRGHEHAIVMKEGSNPVSVRPYRYPQFQKNEIENWSVKCWMLN